MLVGVRDGCPSVIGESTLVVGKDVWKGYYAEREGFVGGGFVAGCALGGFDSVMV